MVFARKADGNLASLVKQLDELVAKNADKKFATFVNLLGDDQEALDATAKKFAADNKLTNVPVVVPNEFENGPGDYGINPKAGITVLIYKRLKVEANHSYDKLDAAAVKSILADVPQVLK